MNSKSLQFIKDNWELLLSPNAQEFEALFLRSPLKTPWLMIGVLEEAKEGAMSLQQLAKNLELHPNTISAIFRALEGKIFIGFDVGIEVELELVEELKRRYVEQILERGNQKAAMQAPVNMKGIMSGKTHYRYEEQKNGRYIFCDRDVDYVQISSPVQDPWGQEWNISFLRQNMKSSRDRTAKRYPYKLKIKLDTPTSEATLIKLERRRMKGVYAFGDYNPVQFFGCPTGNDKQWIFYAVYDFLKAPERI